MFHVDNNSGVANMPALAPAQSNTTTGLPKVTDKKVSAGLVRTG